MSFSLFSQVEDVVISTSSLTVKEIYLPKNKRNPMVKSSVYGTTTKKYSLELSTTSINTYSLNNFVLNGIIKYENGREALLKNNITGEIFILKNSGNLKSLSDSKKILKNVKGDIKGKSVVLYDSEKKETKEFVIE
jgi:hypothetical protein